MKIAISLITAGLLAVILLLGYLVMSGPAEQASSDVADSEGDTGVAAPQYFLEQSLAEYTGVQIAEAQNVGSQLYDRYQCVGCHADGGRALKTLENLGNKYDVDSLAAYLRRPRAPMPVFPLSDAERHDLAIYLLMRYPGQTR